MKKLLVALLLACMVFSVIASADETTYACEENNGVYARFDFGSKSKATKVVATNDDDLRAILEDERSMTHFENLSIEATDDTWIITALVGGYQTVKAGDMYPNDTFDGDADKDIVIPNDMGLDFYDLFDESGLYGAIYCGWGTWDGYPYTTTNFFAEGKWKGLTNYMKLKIKNESKNGRISFRFNNKGSYYTTMVAGFNISVLDEDFKTYLVEMVNAAHIYSGKDAGEGMPGGNNWTWQGAAEMQGLDFYFLSSFCMYDRTPAEFDDAGVLTKGGAYYRGYKKSEGDGESAELANLWAINAKPQAQGLDTQLFVEAGAKVEIDYVIFAPSAEAASCYTSYLDEETETTGYLVVLEEKANALGLTLKGMTTSETETETETEPVVTETEPVVTETEPAVTETSGTTPIVTGTSSIVIALSIMALAAVAAIVIAKKKAR